MYAEYIGKKEITLWFFVNKDKVKSKKRAGGEPTRKASHQSDTQKAKLEDVDQILEKLEHNCAGNIFEESFEHGCTLYKCNNIVLMTIHLICHTSKRVIKELQKIVC